MPTRQEMWDRLQGQFDVVVIGGGITGSGVARDAARRGLRVALIEMNDLAFGTSSRSSKLVHGGLRYLEHYEFSLVFEAVSERRILMDIAPHLVNPLAFLFPVYRGSRQPLFAINAGMWLYDGLSLFRSPKIHRTLKPKEIRQRFPQLRSQGLKGAPLYYDCATDDARLTLETALDAAAVGAVVATRVKVVSLLNDPHGRVCGVSVEDAFSAETREIRAHVVINATGPWTDDVLQMSGSRGDKPILRPTKGVHIVIDQQRLPVEGAVVCMHPHDGRVLFAIPWGERTYIGTTDTDFEGDAADVYATAEDVEYLISAANHYFPDARLQADDVISTWAGLRPLVAAGETGSETDESEVSREHRIVVGQSGLITIAGGKLTTYRKMAEEVVDTATKFLRLSKSFTGRVGKGDTDREPLPGAVGWPEDDDHEAVVDHLFESVGEVLPRSIARHLVDTYGMRAMDIARMVKKSPALGQVLIAGRPEIKAQVQWAVKEELAATLCDVMVRRTQLYYKERHQGLEIAEAVAAQLGALLGWDQGRQEEEIRSYQALVSAARQWRTTP